MATRTIEDRRDRFATILVAPLMSCSARLPVYVLFIGAFVPDHSLLGGIIGLQALTLLAFYCLGALVAIPVAWLLKRTLLSGDPPPFLLELPFVQDARPAHGAAARVPQQPGLCRPRWQPHLGDDDCDVGAGVLPALGSRGRAPPS